MKELQESLHNAGEAVQREKQRADVAENKIERLGRDLATTRMKTSDLVKVRAENDRLSLLLRELKRSSMDLNIQQVATKTTSTPEKIEMRGETDYISMERRVLGNEGCHVCDDHHAQYFIHFPFSPSRVLVAPV